MDIKEASKYIGFKTKTLQKWDREGKLIPSGRTPTNRRIYTKEQLDIFKGIKNNIKKYNIVYCRVSSNNQKNDLENQKKMLEQFCIAKGLEIKEMITEIGGGLNFKRPKFLKIFDKIENNEIENLIIAHKDRLCRFGFEWFEYFCNKHNCNIIIMNTEILSPQEEMVNDLMSIIHCFSCRLYGLRNYKKELKKYIK